MDFEKLDIEKLIFEDETRLFNFSYWLLYFAAYDNILFTIAKPKSDRLGIKSSTTILGSIFGFSESHHEKIFSYYDQQTDTRNKLAIIFFIFFYTAFLGLTSPAIDYLNTFRNFGETAFAISSALVNITIFYIGYVLSIKIFLLLFEKYYAESLCVQVLFHILLSLSRNDVLCRPDRKRVLLTNIRYLAKRVQLLGIAYRNNSPHNSKWIQNHFDDLSEYIRERERWAIAPRQGTLSSLRTDFYGLAEIFVSGNFGEYDWKKPSTDGSDNLESSTNKKSLLSIGGKIIRLIGYITPIFLIGLYLWNPNNFPIINLNRDVATIVLLAWILLSLDIGLNLGIVTSLITLAKDIKDLGKI